MTRVTLIRLLAVAFALLLGGVRAPAAPAGDAHTQTARLCPQGEPAAQTTCERIPLRAGVDQLVAKLPFAPAVRARVTLPRDIIQPSVSGQPRLGPATTISALPNSRAPPAWS